MKRKRYYAIKIESWDCNRHPFTVWNIIDREPVTKDDRIGQAWSKEAKDLILTKLNNKA